MQVQTAYSGLIHDDYGDLKKRVDEALTKQKTAGTPPPTTLPLLPLKPRSLVDSNRGIPISGDHRGRPFLFHSVNNFGAILVQHSHEM